MLHAGAFPMQTWESFNQLPVSEGTWWVGDVMLPDLGQPWQLHVPMPQEARGRLRGISWPGSNPDMWLQHL